MGTASNFKPFFYCSSRPAKFPRINAVDLIETVQSERVFTYHQISPLLRRIPADSPWPKVISFSYYYQQAASSRSSIFRGTVLLLKERSKDLHTGIIIYRQTASVYVTSRAHFNCSWSSLLKSEPTWLRQQELTFKAIKYVSCVKTEQNDETWKQKYSHLYFSSLYVFGPYFSPRFRSPICRTQQQQTNKTTK